MWEPRLYQRFDQPRLRPGLDLMSRISSLQPRRVVDLGCGSGALTVLLAEQWPAAEVIGVDSSPEMLAAAPARAGVEWVEADLREWEPICPPDLIFSNAVLHWVDDHSGVLARLAGILAPGGVLAAQIPANFASPAHRSIEQAVLAPRWRDRLEPYLRRDPVGAPADYQRCLARLGAEADVWTTEYLHVLVGDDAILEWLAGAALRELLSVLEEDEQAAFLSDLRPLLASRYPAEPDGSVLFPFRRLFFVARF